MVCLKILLFYILLYSGERCRQEWTRFPIMVTRNCFYLVANLCFFACVYMYIPTYLRVGMGSFITYIEIERYVRNVCGHSKNRFELHAAATLMAIIIQYYLCRTCGVFFPPKSYRVMCAAMYAIIEECFGYSRYHVCRNRILFCAIHR